MSVIPEVSCSIVHSLTDDDHDGYGYGEDHDEEDHNGEDHNGEDHDEEGESGDLEASGKLRHKQQTLRYCQIFSWEI